MLLNVSWTQLSPSLCLQCDPGQGADAFYDLMYRKPTLRMLIASGAGACSEVTETLGEIAPYWNLVLVSAFPLLANSLSLLFELFRRL